MTFNPEIHHRRSIRLKGYDYAQAGHYYVTICTHERNCVLGDIINAKMVLNEFGKIVENCWLDLPNHYNNIELYEFAIMPNHFHGIICITIVTGHDVGAAFVGAGLKPAPTDTVHMKPAPTDTVHMKPAPTDTAHMKPAPTDTVHMKPAPTDTVHMKPAPTNTVHMKPVQMDHVNTQNQHGLPEIVRAFKTFSSRRINEMRQTQGIPVWQRNYYEHIIRNDESYHRISEYILNNPANWDEDDYYDR